MLQDCKGMYLQPGMYIVYAGMYSQSLDLRIARIQEIKKNNPRYGNPEEYLSVKSVVRDWTSSYNSKVWVRNNDGKAHALKNMDGVFAVPETCIPDLVIELLS
jgi:hypothetical protein